MLSSRIGLLTTLGFFTAAIFLHAMEPNVATSDIVTLLRELGC